MAGLVPAISIRVARCPPYRGRRDKPGDDTPRAGARSVRMRPGLLIGVRQRAVVLDQVGALLDKELVLAIRAQQLDAGVAQVLVMDMEFLVALGAAGIKMLDHVGLLVGVLYRRC